MANRDELSAMLLRDAQGFEGSNGMQHYDATQEAFFADDPISRGGFSNVQLQLAVANGAALDLKLFTQEHLDAAALPTGLVGPALQAYKNLVRYLSVSPSQMRSVLILSSEAVSSAPLLSSMKVAPTRETPFGAQCSNSLSVQNYQTTQDYQANRISVPLVVTLDSFSFLKLTTDVNLSGGNVTFNLSFIIGKRIEQRRNIGNASPVVPRSGGRGPAAI